MNNPRLAAERDKKRCLIQMIEAEETYGLNIFAIFKDKDPFDKRDVSQSNFKYCLEKILPSITREEISLLFQEFQVSGAEKANYDLLLGRLNVLRKKRKVLNDILEQVLDNVESKDNTLFDFFEEADKDKSGDLSKKEFLSILDKIGIYYDEDQMEDLFFFLDTNGNGEINYKELNTYFTKYVKRKGKDIQSLSRSSFFKGSTSSSTNLE